VIRSIRICLKVTYFGLWLEEAARAFAGCPDFSDILGYVYRHDMHHQSSFWGMCLTVTVHLQHALVVEGKIFKAEKMCWLHGFLHV